MLCLCEEIYGAYSQREYAVCVFIDLPNAFDTFSHSILLWKLQLHGMNGLAYDWFKSYLSITQLKLWLRKILWLKKYCG